MELQVRRVKRFLGLTLFYLFMLGLCFGMEVLLRLIAHTP